MGTLMSFEVLAPSKMVWLGRDSLQDVHGECIVVRTEECSLTFPPKEISQQPFKLFSLTRLFFSYNNGPLRQIIRVDTSIISFIILEKLKCMLIGRRLHAF
jgi:hypothetical protein